MYEALNFPHLTNMMDTGATSTTEVTNCQLELYTHWALNELFRTKWPFIQTLVGDYELWSKPRFTLTKGLNIFQSIGLPLVCKTQIFFKLALLRGVWLFSWRLATKIWFVQILLLLIICTTTSQSVNCIIWQYGPYDQWFIGKK